MVTRQQGQRTASIDPVDCVELDTDIEEPEAVEGNPADASVVFSVKTETSSRDFRCG